MNITRSNTIQLRCVIKSSFELFKIISMISIICHHFAYHELGEGFIITNTYTKYLLGIFNPLGKILKIFSFGESLLLAILPGFCIFLIFKNLRPRNNVVINFIETTCVGILIFHNHNIFKIPRIIKLCNAVDSVLN